MGLFDRWRKPSPPPRRLLSYQVANLQGRGTRDYQEDSFAFANALDVTEIRRRGLLAIVADGMGGLRDGRLVSQTCVAGLLSAFSTLEPKADLPDQLRRWVEETNQALFRQFQGEGGTTLAACLCFQEALWWISVGDSGLYLLRNGGLFRLNVEQNYLTQLRLEAIRAGRLDPTVGLNDPDGPRLSAFLGMEQVDAPDRSLHPLPLQDGDTLLLCSDGISGVLDEAELRDCLEQDSAEGACGRLEAAIRGQARVYQDNYTALVIKCGY